jgi:uncharacterized protein
MNADHRFKWLTSSPPAVHLLPSFEDEIDGEVLKCFVDPTCTAHSRRPAMKIGTISDTHDHCDYINRFISRFEQERVDMLIHLGDIVAPFAAIRFAEIAKRIPFVALFGNNDGERAGLKKMISEWGSIEDGPKRLELDGKVIVINHYPMASEEILAIFPDADFYLSGHTHIRVDERAGRLRLINPGEACAWLYGEATAGILEPASDSYRTITP